MEDIAVRSIGRRRGSGDVTTTLAVDSAPLKPGSRGSEDKVGGPFNITLLETETGSRTSEEKGILIAEKTAVYKTNPVAFRMACPNGGASLTMVRWRKVIAEPSTRSV
mgnify:CR=1 FL=1